MGQWRLPPDGGHMDKADGVYLQNMTGKQVAERLRTDDIVIVPIGSTEFHGANACYGEDTFLVTRMAELVAEKTGCTVSQPLWFGSHPYPHLGMPGTIVVPEDIFVGLIRAVIAGLWNTGFRKQILLNGHGQEYVIPNALHQFAKKYQVPSILAVSCRRNTRMSGGTSCTGPSQDTVRWGSAVSRSSCIRRGSSESPP